MHVFKEDLTRPPWLILVWLTLINTVHTVNTKYIDGNMSWPWSLCQMALLCFDPLMCNEAFIAQKRFQTV